MITTDFLSEPVVTNDVVEISGQGKFIWLGRWDRVINTGGVKVAPEKIEKALEKIFHQNNFHNRFFIAALADPKLSNRVVLVLEGVQFSSDLLNQSLNTLKSDLLPYEMPREVYWVPEFVLTETQKTDRIQTLPEIKFLMSVK